MIEVSRERYEEMVKVQQEMYRAIKFTKEEAEILKDKMKSDLIPATNSDKHGKFAMDKKDDLDRLEKLTDSEDIVRFFFNDSICGEMLVLFYVEDHIDFASDNMKDSCDFMKLDKKSIKIFDDIFYNMYENDFNDLERELANYYVFIRNYCADRFYEDESDVVTYYDVLTREFPRMKDYFKNIFDKFTKED